MCFLYIFCICNYNIYIYIPYFYILYHSNCHPSDTQHNTDPLSSVPSDSLSSVFPQNCKKEMPAHITQISFADRSLSFHLANNKWTTVIKKRSQSKFAGSLQLTRSCGQHPTQPTNLGSNEPLIIGVTSSPKRQMKRDQGSWCQNAEKKLARIFMRIVWYSLYYETGFQNGSEMI